MLMPIQLPDDFVVTDRFKLEKWNFEPWVEWSALFVNAIEMPVDRRTVVEALVSEQAKLMLADLVRLTHDLRSLFGQGMADQLDALSRVAIGEEKFAR